MTRLLCPALVGWDAELGQLRRHLSELQKKGRGGAVMLLGEAGAGKSRFVRECLRPARAAGVRILVGRALDSPMPLAYRPLIEAMASVLRGVPAPDLGDVAPFRAALGPIVPQWRQERTGPAEPPVVVGEGLVRLLRAAGGREPVLLVLEDLHWADPETLDVVAYLADNLGEEPILCLLTARPDAHGVLQDACHSRGSRPAGGAAA